MIGVDPETEAEVFPGVERAIVSQSSHGRRVLKFTIPVVLAHFGGITSCAKMKVCAVGVCGSGMEGGGGAFGNTR